ncbi:MAG: glycoside hydrolase family 3 N-terminal domain-containing protein [Sulfurimonas sp.]|nr:glycoside hydrolase family 3 N-terminal domain-containing protein [Sulfurimonas sp.]
MINFISKKRVKNILSPYQIQNLTKEIRKFAQRELFISIDQEGGKVARLKPKYGFEQIPSASSVATMSLDEASAIYKKNAKMLHTSGINTNFAPVVDLAINKKNRVIVGLERSYGTTSKEVLKFAKVMIQGAKKSI